MDKEICVDCKKGSYNCHDWCLLYLKNKTRHQIEMNDESKSYAIDKYWALKKSHGGRRK